MRKFYFLLLATLFLIPVLSLQAQSVDILWQGGTYVPPFYQGKTLWSKQSGITLVAIPQGLGASSGLNYRWTKNGTVLGNKSGVGKNTLYYVDTILSKPQNIKVDIMSGKSVRASATTVITPITPILAVYENDPLYGFMFHRETRGAYSLKTREVSFSAFPLFFSTASRMENTLNYEWRNNAGSTETQNSVTYRTPDNAKGTAEVGARISNPKKVTQDAKNNFLIQFDSSIPNI